MVRFWKSEQVVLSEIAVLNSYAADEFALSDNAYMPIQVAAGETDDPQFITLLNSLVRGLVKAAKKQRDLTSRTLRFH